MTGLLLAIIAVLSAALAAVTISFAIYVRKQNKLIENASEKIGKIIDGDTDERIECLKEGRIYSLFHDINSLAAILGAHADNEEKNKEFLKNTIQDISHQLRTPISALSIYNEVLQGDDIDEETMKHFNSLSEQELGRMENLVQNLLKITKLDSMTVEMEKYPESLTELAEGSVRRFAYRAETEEKTLKVKEELPDCNVFCDKTWMNEAFDNLVKNALDHTKEGDSIVIGWKMSGAGVIVSFEDTGSGIHEEDIYYIFNRFYRSRFSSDTTGIGLGLPLTKSIIENNDGTIEVSSELGKGTVFTVYLPLAKD